MGNLRSVSKALEFVASKEKIFISNKPDEISSADKVVFPGVGALQGCMSELQQLDLISTVTEVANTKPFLGICLGMQALFSRGEENGGCSGLDVLPGEVIHFPENLPEQGLKIPHMGWSKVHQVGDHPVMHGIPEQERFYFVHSYFVKPELESDNAATCDYGIEFCCAVARDNLFATQFHPEKSHDAGLALLKNFITWSP